MGVKIATKNMQRTKEYVRLCFSTVFEVLFVLFSCFLFWKASWTGRKLGAEIETENLKVEKKACLKDSFPACEKIFGSFFFGPGFLENFQDNGVSISENSRESWEFS